MSESPPSPQRLDDCGLDVWTDDKGRIHVFVQAPACPKCRSTRVASDKVCRDEHNEKYWRAKCTACGHRNFFVHFEPPPPIAHLLDELRAGRDTNLA